MTVSYTERMQQIFDERLDVAVYSAPKMAKVIVEELRENDPELLAGWLDERAESVMTDAIGRISSSQRSKARHDKPKGAFAEWADKYESGEHVGTWLPTRYVVDDEDNRKRLADMTRDELEFVIATYRDRAAVNRFEALFLSEVRNRVHEDETVGEVLSEEDIAEIRDKVAEGDNDDDEDDE